MTATTTDRSPGQDQTNTAQTMTFSKAINSALRDALEEDSKVVLMGRTSGPWAGSSASPTGCSSSSVRSG